MQHDWLALVLTLPTSPSAVRVRIWRALKSSGCGALRDGVYLMPAQPGAADVFDALADEVRQAGGEATRLELGARDAEQQDSVRGAVRPLRRVQGIRGRTGAPAPRVA